MLLTYLPVQHGLQHQLPKISQQLQQHYEDTVCVKNVHY